MFVFRTLRNLDVNKFNFHNLSVERFTNYEATTFSIIIIGLFD